MSSETVQTGPGEVYCSDCGSVIKSNAEICPECGVRQSSASAETNDSYGFIFAFKDAWKRQKALRHIINIGLIFVSFGTYAGLLLLEAFIHYRNLNSGSIEPYAGEENQQVWVIPLKPKQYQREKTEAQPVPDNRASQQPETVQPEQQTSSGEWMDELDESDNRIQIENQSGDSVSAKVGIRTAEETSVLGAVELEPGSKEEWDELSIDDQFEVGVISDGERVAERFGDGPESSYNIEIAITDGGTEFTNLAVANATQTTNERAQPPNAERAVSRTSSGPASRSGTSEGTGHPDATEETSKTGGGKILLLGLVIMVVIGPAVSLIPGLPGFVSSILWGAGVLTIIFGLYRLISARWL